MNSGTERDVSQASSNAACALCGSTRSTYLIVDARSRMTRCTQCQLVTRTDDGRHGLEAESFALDADSEHTIRDMLAKGGGTRKVLAVVDETPCALERVITDQNAPKLRCRILAEGANGPTTNSGDRIIEDRGDIEIIPDVLCNAGGVIVSYFEWLQNLQNYYWDRDEVMTKLFAFAVCTSACASRCATTSSQATARTSSPSVSA